MIKPNIYLYMVTMMPPIPVEFVISSDLEFKDKYIWFKGIKTKHDSTGYGRHVYTPNTSKRINNQYWVTFEILGECDEDGKLVQE